MAGLNVGMSNWGGFRGGQETAIPKQPEQSQRMNQGNFRNFQGRGQGMDTGPSKAQGFRGPAGGGGINTGRTSQMGITPSPMDPYRTYGSVMNGRMTAPSNPYGQNQPIDFTPGGTYGGPIQTGPSVGGGATQNPNPYLERGGFTGGQTPSPDVMSGSAGATGYYNPPTQIPNMPSGMNRPNMGGLGAMYGGAGPSLGGSRFGRGGLFY